MNWRPVLALAVSLFLAAETPSKDESKADLDKIQGTWKVDKLEVSGDSIPPELLKNCTFTFKGNKLTATLTTKSTEATITLNAAKTPKEIDITPTEGPDKGKTVLGIYQLDGDDLKIAFQEGKERPKEFKTKANLRSGLVVLKRQKP